MIKYVVKLTEEEQEELLKMISKGVHSSARIKNALILLNSDISEHAKKYNNQTISDIVHVSMKTIDRVKKKFVEEGFDAVFNPPKSKRTYLRKADGEVEAHLVALCCGEVPAGFAKWSLRLLADKMVELNYVESISHETVRQVLKKTNLSPGKA
jgi:transposase